ncbi:MAG: virulence protein RhuM/Fic/DOC family protein [Desulfobacterales bacterium]|nr:virulence protein RhuM/Fic/DOC family protein [Desulfobacterales bacterium]MBF0395625.1 virulence protein RhuM/Fic/DOC family protein [Desulfobacterales bacterium]
MVENKGEIIIYQTPEGKSEIEVKLENETLWLTEQQIALLFDRNRTVIGRHIKNITKKGELDEKSNVQKMHIALSDKPVTFYNLDMILSIGYRVNSKRGTQFRIWANTVLKEYLIKGYTINEKRLKERENEIKSLKIGIQLLERTIINQAQQLEEAKTLVNIIADFSNGLSILDDYDNERLDDKGITEKEAVYIPYEEFKGIIPTIKDEFNSALFGMEKDSSFQSSVGQIYQSFGGEELYPSIEEKAAVLLYLIVKNHSFSDGNKRIAAALFLYFLNKNGMLYRKDGTTLFDGNTLASVTLMIAESKSGEMEIIKKIIISILNRSNK